MNIIRSGRWGLVLDSESLVSKRQRAHKLGPLMLTGGREHAGHFILERYTVDDDGNICVSPSLSMSELQESLEIMKAELQTLIDEARRRFPDAAPVERMHIFGDWGAMTPRRD
jgi:hypothetical protein